MAENLCGLQVKQFRKEYGIIKNVSDRDYVSNSFHCHVTEDITPITKQNREGVNLALSYCDDCGYQAADIGDECPICGSKNLTKIDRMNGYLAYSRRHGESRMNNAKMAEIADRKSM